MSSNITDLPYTAPAPTSLPERDIPRETLSHAADPQVAVNYLPKQAPYIPPPPQAPVPSYPWIDEFRVPIILSLMYYIFQLNITRDMLQKFVPFIFQADGNLTSQGIIVKSCMFGGAFYALTYILEHFSQPKIV